jgi:sec-independent protein translocase protein TatA
MVLNPAEEICIKLFNLVFYKIFNAAQNKYFSTKTIVLRIFLYLCSNIRTICFGIKYTIMGRLGLTEILVIVGIVLLLFGGKKIPELMKGLGSGIKEFKNAAKDDQSAVKKQEEEVK